MEIFAELGDFCDFFTAKKVSWLLLWVLQFYALWSVKWTAFHK